MDIFGGIDGIRQHVIAKLYGQKLNGLKKVRYSSIIIGAFESWTKTATNRSMIKVVIPRLGASFQKSSHEICASSFFSWDVVVDLCEYIETEWSEVPRLKFLGIQLNFLGAL